MRLVRILASVAVGLALAGGASAQLVPVPGTLVALAPPKGFPAIKDLKTMRVDYAGLADRLETLSKGYLKDWVDRNSR